MTLTSWNSAKDKGFGQAPGPGWGNSPWQPQSPGRVAEAAVVLVAPAPVAVARPHRAGPARAPLQPRFPVRVVPARGCGAEVGGAPGQPGASRVPIWVPTGKANTGCEAVPAPQHMPGLRTWSQG